MISHLKILYQKFYNLGLSDQDTFLTRQREIRAVEWSAIEKYIPIGSNFLDIGCGKGYSMSLAIEKRKCQATGVDPFPDHAGVAPSLRLSKGPYIIEKGFCENLPFENESFDVVYSSHMLEHTTNYEQSLSEMHRVLKNDGILIMGVPTATMALIRLISILIFSSHRNIIELIRWPLRTTDWKTNHPISSFIVPYSHGNPKKSIYYDLYDYRVSEWRKRTTKYFNIQEEVYPALYSFPDFPKLFRLHSRKRTSSSVFFVATKKKRLLS